MVARRTSGVSEGFAEGFLLGVGVSEVRAALALALSFPAVVFFFFFPFGEASFAGDFFGFGCVVAAGVSLGVADASGSSVGDFFFFGVGEGSDFSAEDFFGLDFLFGDEDGEVFFFFLAGEAFDFGEGVGVFSLAGESTARAFKIGLPSSVCCA